MKKIQNKIGLRLCFGLIVGGLFLNPLLASAQSTTDEGTITVTAEVSPTFLVESIQDLDFGNLLRDSKKSINALTGAINTSGGNKNSLPGGQRGGFVVIADAGSEVKFELTLPSTLQTNPFNGSSLQPDFSRLDGTASRTEAFIVLEGDLSGTITDVGVTGAEFGAISGGVSATIGNEGDYFSFPENEITAGGQNGNGVAVVIGGAISTFSATGIGQYTGDITLTVEVED